MHCCALIGCFKCLPQLAISITSPSSSAWWSTIPAINSMASPSVPLKPNMLSHALISGSFWCPIKEHSGGPCSGAASNWESFCSLRSIKLVRCLHCWGCIVLSSDFWWLLCWVSGFKILSTSSWWETIGKAFNLAIWRSEEKSPNYSLSILNPNDSGRLAGHLSTYDYALYLYFNQDSCILSRECDVGDSSLSRKEFRVTNEICSCGSRPQTVGPPSSVSPWSTTNTL